MGKLKLFRRVDENVFRSAKPTSVQHIELLRKRSIGGIISLDPLDSTIAAKATRMGMKIIEIPIVEDAPLTNREILKAARFIMENAKHGKKTLIHCEQGKQRTSNMVLAYLIAKATSSVSLDKQ